MNATMLETASSESPMRGETCAGAPLLSGVTTKSLSSELTLRRAHTIRAQIEKPAKSSWSSLRARWAVRCQGGKRRGGRS